jgi:hypothetical protein
VASLASERGIYRSIDGGNSWQLVFSNTSKSFEVNDLVYCEINDAFYAATTDGIYKSVDDGNSWSLLKNFKGGIIVINVDSRGVIYAGTYEGIYRFNINSENEWVPTGFFSTVPSFRYIAKIDTEGWCNIIEIDPKNLQVIYATGWHGLWKSENGGNTWQSITARAQSVAIPFLLYFIVFSSMVTLLMPLIIIPLSEQLKISLLEITAGPWLSIVIPLTAYSTLTCLNTREELEVPSKCMVFHAPALGETRLDVNTIGSASVPVAFKFPSTVSEKPSANSTRTPGNMVNVTPGSTYVLPITLYVSTGDQVVSDVICPSIHIMAFAEGKWYEEIAIETPRKTRTNKTILIP